MDETKGEALGSDAGIFRSFLFCGLPLKTRQFSESSALPIQPRITMKKLLRIIVPFLILLLILWRWSGTQSAPSLITADSSNRSSAQKVPRSEADRSDGSPSGNGASASSRRERNERDAETSPEITAVDDFGDEHLVHEHVIHTMVPAGSSVVVAGERDANGKRLFTILTPAALRQDGPKGQIKLASRTYGLDDNQIAEAGMQTLLGNETRLHNQGEIWSAEDITATHEKWPADAALSMPTVMLEPGSEGVIEIGSLVGEAPYLYRTKVQVQSSPGGFELKTTLQTFRKH
jgi:hypothetical protein